MTTKIANIANLALHVFQQHSTRTSVPSANSFNFDSNQNIHHPTNSSAPPSPNHSENPSAVHNELPDSIQRLLSSIHSLTPKDVGFDGRWISDPNVCAAPVAYVHMTENQVFSMGMFILKPGSRIPLHDHPGMFGILKVIHGALRCRSFTRMHTIKPSDLDHSTSSFSVFAGSKWHLTGLIVARPHQDMVITPDNYPQMLSPTEGNLHEITPVGGPVVFLDILAPPYNPGVGKRECRFYKEVILPQSLFGCFPPSNRSPNMRGDNSSDECLNETPESEHDNFPMTTQFDDPLAGRQSPVVYFVETNQPKDYWCEAAEYNGPSVI